MALTPPRWKAITQSQYAWEREALEFIRSGLPDTDPYAVWSNFEFIAHDGTVNEVDALVFTPRGFFLVEIKSRPGVVSGDSGTWTWRQASGRTFTDDNPVIAANRKARKLADLLRAQPKALGKLRLPYLDVLVFLSAAELQCNLPDLARMHVCLRDRPPAPGRDGTPGILAGLRERNAPGLKQEGVPMLDRPLGRAVTRAMEEAGIRPSQRQRRVGDYVLDRVLYESPKHTYQDWEAHHVSHEKNLRRVRIYTLAQHATTAERERITRAAAREFTLLNSLEHPGILQVDTATTHELGPALIFRYDAQSVRLDHYLQENAGRLSFDLKVHLLRQIAEALQYAHGKKISHRALSPTSVLITPTPAEGTAPPRVQVFNWQFGREAVGSNPSARPDSLTVHAESMMEDATLIYLAPEFETATDGVAGDLFSLGALAYHLFSGRPPAASRLELLETLAKQRSGLDVRAVLDGVSEALQYLVECSTAPNLSDRTESAGTFLAYLEDVVDAFTTPEERAEEPSVENPLEAQKGDRLPGGITVQRRLGAGSSAVAFLVEHEGKERVLKIARDPSHNDRLREEADTLRKLESWPNIATIHLPVEIGGLAGFLMQRAGELTVAEQLQRDGPFHLEYLKRLGRDLLDTICFLEGAGYAHRDLKPENIGVGELPGGGVKRLILFDFSLSRTPVDNIRAGTVGYLDPFLILRGKPPRWDLHAERFAAAVTLYEMATGKRPPWSLDGSDPAMLDDEFPLTGDGFDPSVREPMLAFFTRAFRRDARQRFDNGHEMLHAWTRVFNATTKTSTGTENAPGPLDFDAVHQATAATPVVTLGLSPLAASVLDRMDALTVGDLLAQSWKDLYRQPGVDRATSREIQELVRLLRHRFPAERRGGAESVAPEHAGKSDATGVDIIAGTLVPAARSEKDGPQTRLLRHLLELDNLDTPAPFRWPTQADFDGEALTTLGFNPERLAEGWERARNRWRKDAAITALRRDFASYIETQGGVVTARELAEGLLALRGSLWVEPKRTRYASAVVRAALEAEAGSERPRFISSRSLRGEHHFIVVSEPLATYAERLGVEADTLAALDPLPTPLRVLETLRRIEPPAALTAPLSDARLVRLAAAASRGAAVSVRLEIYPRGLAPARALRLAHGALLGKQELSVRDIADRVRSRYPDAGELPDRPELDALLAESPLELDWSPEAAHGKGAYRHRFKGAAGASSASSILSRHSTATSGQPAAPGAAPDQSEELAAARLFENRLRYAEKHGAFLALTVESRELARTQAELVSRFAVEPVNGDRVFITAMRDTAAALKIKWPKILQVDASPRSSRDWKNLQNLVDRCEESIAYHLGRSPDRTVLLTNAGLFARYGRMRVLENLRERISRGDPVLHGLWLLLPCDDPRRGPMIDEVAVPLVTANQWAAVPAAWLQNVHRAPSPAP